MDNMKWLCNNWSIPGAVQKWCYWIVVGLELKYMGIDGREILTWTSTDPMNNMVSVGWCYYCWCHWRLELSRCCCCSCIWRRNDIKSWRIRVYICVWTTTDHCKTTTDHCKTTAVHCKTTTDHLIIRTGHLITTTEHFWERQIIS
jgi:hypothetical protein